MPAFLVASLLMMSALITLFAQRSNDYRDPDLTYEEGWTTLFNGKDFTGWVPVIQNPETKSAKKYRESEIGEQNTFSIENGMIVTTGTPNGYVRTTDVYDNYAFHLEVRFPRNGNSGVLIHVQRDEVWPRGIECQLYQGHMGRIFSDSRRDHGRRRDDPLRGKAARGVECL